MKEGWTTRWKALLIWLSGYLSIVAFAIAGGYAIVKSDDEELKKTAKQALILNLELRGDFSRAGKTDSLEGSVNYREVEEQVIALVENSSFHLLEALGEAVAALCLSFPEVVSVKITLDKPGAALRADSIALEIERSR